MVHEHPSLSMNVLSLKSTSSFASPPLRERPGRLSVSHKRVGLAHGWRKSVRSLIGRRGKKERLSGWTMAPGEEQIPHRLLQNVFGAVWSPGNAASHGQGNEPMDQSPASFHQIMDV